MKFPKEIIIRFEVDAKGTTVTAMDGGELIRCRDCLYWGEDGYHNGCKYANCIMEENDYCSMAERRTK